MPLYAEIRNSDNTLVRIVDQPNDWTPESVAHKFGPEFETCFVPVLDEAAPDYNPLSHRLAPHDRLEQGQWKRGFTVVEKEAPAEVPLWAFRAVLTTMGLAGNVTTLIATLDEPARTVASVQWEYANYIRRDHPVIVQLAPALNLTEQDVANIFKQAALLS